MPRKPAKRETLTAAGVASAAVGRLGASGELTKDERIERGKSDFAWWCHYYLGHYFSLSAAKFHAELAEMLTVHEKGAAAAPREHAKSTLLFAYMLWCVSNRRKKFIVLIRATDDDARMAVDDARREFEENNRLIGDYGDLVGERKWAEYEFETSSGVKVAARSRGSKIRGLRFRENRPDLTICDDLEDDELVLSRERVEKLIRWFDRTVSNLGQEGQLFVVGTILSRVSLMTYLLKERPNYVTRIWRAIEKGKALWPAKWSLAKLKAKREEIGRRAFDCEFMNEPRNDDDQVFSPDDWKFFTDADIADLDMVLAAAIDPAVGKRRKAGASSDYTAVVVVGAHGGNYYVLSVKLARMKFQRQIELVLSTARRWPRIWRFGVETTAYQDVLKQDLDEQSAKANLQLPTKEVKPSGDKMSRIERLQPLAEQGRLWFPHPTSSYRTNDIDLCLEQFEDLGVSANHDDGPDAVEMAIGLLRGRRQRKGRVSYARRAA